MFAVDWEPIFPDFIAVTTPLDQAFCCIVTWLAQRLQLAESERIPVSLVRFNVVDDASRHDQTSCCTESTEGVLTELVVGNSLPTLQCVPPPPATVRRTWLSMPTAAKTAHHRPKTF
jgi:hypothetical protein